MRVVIDTNVLISSYLSSTSPSTDIMRLIRARRFQSVLSKAILEEYETSLRRPHFSDLHRLTDQGVHDVLSFLTRVAHVVETVPSIRVVSADPKDDMFIEAAVAGEADVIVSGDRHHLDLRTYEGIRILAPAAFLRLLDLASA